LNFHEKTADLLYKAVKHSVVDPNLIEMGDVIVITGPTSDIVGEVQKVSRGAKGTLIELKTPESVNETSSGVHHICVDASSFIHVIQKVSMLDLRKHYEYERENEKSNKEIDMFKKLENSPKERPQFSVESSEKSVLPTSKISLSLRKTTEG
jgi:hypothetical protein